MAGVGDGDAVRYGVVDGVQAGRHAVGAEPLGLLVEMVQDLLRRQVQAREGLCGGPQLTHDRGRGHRMPHDIAHDQRHPAAGQRDRVVPVTADPCGLGRRQIARGEPYARGPGQMLREHGALELVGDVRLTVVQHRLVDAERAVRGELGRDQQVVVLEREALRAAQEDRRADHPAPAPERGQDGPLAARDDQGAVLAQEFGQRGTGGRAVREHRAHPAQHLRERPAGPYLAQFGDRGGQLGAQLRGFRRRQGERGEAGLGVALLRDAVGAPQPQHDAVGHRPLVADRQRVAQIDEDRVGEGRHGGPAQPHHDLVEVQTAGDPPGRGADETQPVPVPAHRRGPPGRHPLPRTAFGAHVTARLGRDRLGRRTWPVAVGFGSGRRL